MRAAELKRLKKLWLTCLFKLTFFGRKRTTFQEFSERAFTMLGWHKEDTMEHPLFKKYWNDDKEIIVKGKDLYSNVDRIPDNQLYEMKVS